MLLLVSAICILFAVALREAAWQRQSGELKGALEQTRFHLNSVPQPLFPQHYIRISGCVEGGGWLQKISSDKSPASSRLVSSMQFKGDGAEDECYISGIQLRYLWTFEERDIYEVIICGPQQMPTIADEQTEGAIVSYVSYRGKRITAYEDDRITIIFEPPQEP
jgi:hypothetical protein